MIQHDSRTDNSCWVTNRLVGGVIAEEMVEKLEELTIDGVKFEGSYSGPDVVEYVDKSGHILKYRQFEGINVESFFQPSTLKQIKSFKFRPDDVYLPGYPRSGTNWTHEMAQMLLNGKPETIQGLKPHLEIMLEEDMNKLPSPRVINAHINMSKAPEDLKEKKCKIIFTLRDPKDVVVSVYKAIYGHAWSDKPYRGSFEDYLHMFLEGKADFNGLFAHWRAAEEFFDRNPDIPVYFQVYEDAIKDPVGSVKKLSDFLGLLRDDDLCKAIADKCEFSRMKVDKDPYTLKMDGVDVLYRQGSVGDWKNYFTEELLDLYYRVYEEKMAGSRFYNMYARKK